MFKLSVFMVLCLSILVGCVTVKPSKDIGTVPIPVEKEEIILDSTLEPLELPKQKYIINCGDVVYRAVDYDKAGFGYFIDLVNGDTIIHKGKCTVSERDRYKSYLCSTLETKPIS